MSTVPTPTRPTATRPARVPGLDLVVPGDWWRIPLQPQPMRRRALRALVQRQFTGLEKHLALRHQVETALDDVADEAAGTGGVVMWFSTATVEGLPLPVSLVLAELPHATIDTVRESLEADDDTVVGSLGPGRVVRRCRVRDQSSTVAHLVAAADRAAGKEPTPALAALHVDYWAQRPSGGLVQLAFTSPLVALREPLVELFDTVVDSLTWREPPGGDGAS